MSEITEKDIIEWNRLDVLLKKTKSEEMSLRKKISKSMKHTNGKASVIFGGLLVIGKQGISTKIDEKEELLVDRDGMSPELQSCFPLDVKFSKTGYGKLSDGDKCIADGYIVDKPSAPTLIVEIA